MTDNDLKRIDYTIRSAIESILNKDVEKIVQLQYEKDKEIIMAHFREVPGTGTSYD